MQERAGGAIELARAPRVAAGGIGAESELGGFLGDLRLAVLCDVPGACWPDSVTCRCRFKRRMSAGRLATDEPDDVSSGTLPTRATAR